METGMTAKYFKYAIGEIILVVIGILIALSINNWNEKQKTKTISKQLFKELYLEYKQAGENLKTSYEGNKIYTNYLEDVIKNWQHLDLKILSEFEHDNIFAKNYCSTIYYLSSFSFFNDPQNTIYQKAIGDGSINLINSDFIVDITYTYSIIYRLNEMITQEYELGKEINLHIAKNYNSILINLQLEQENSDKSNMDEATLNKLLVAFKNDGTLKYLIKSRLDLAKIRMIMLESFYTGVEGKLEKYKYLFND